MQYGLQRLAAYLRHRGFAPIFRGDPYGQGLDWLYFNCYLDEIAVQRRFSLGPEITYTAYDGRLAGQEAGFYDPGTGFGIMGHHPDHGRAAGKPEITGAE